MGGELVTLDWTVEGRPDRTAIAMAVAGVPDFRLKRLVGESQPLRRCETMSDVTDALIKGAIVYDAVVNSDHSHATAQQIRDELWHYTVGGQSRGDYPFDGFGDLWAFLDAADLDPDLGTAACFAGWGIVAETAKEADIIEMFAVAMASENIPADKSSRIVARVAEALGVR